MCVEVDEVDEGDYDGGDSIIFDEF